jgi:hypothetical protein
MGHCKEEFYLKHKNNQGLPCPTQIHADLLDARLTEKPIKFFRGFKKF